MQNVDVAILGAGPAGSALAAALAGAYSVVLIDRWAHPPEKIGESLIPAARRVLRDLGLLDLIEARGYAAYNGNVSYWTSDQEERRDFIANPDGPGWHLDRADFDPILRKAAVTRGAQLMVPARLGQMEQQGAHWSLSAETRDGAHPIRARVLVDASGRSSVVAKRLGVPRHVRDRMAAHWVHGVDNAKAPDLGLSTIAAAPEGWWYTAPLDPATGKRVLALHCDPDHTVPDLTQATMPKQIQALLAEAEFTPSLPGARCSAGTTTLSTMAGRGWLAIGDAGLGMDPLSSRGIYHALYTALAAAASIDHALQSNDTDFGEFSKHMTSIAGKYTRDLSLFYDAQTRWSDAPFWFRRTRAAQAV